MGASEPALWLELADTELEIVTRVWIDTVVVGLNLCPFAQKVRGDPSRVVIARTESDCAPLDMVRGEVERLARLDPDEPATTFILLPDEAIADFDEYMERIARPAEELADQASGGSVQVVFFHPRASWGDAAESDAAQYTTRSPVPMLHLLRSRDIERAEDAWVAQHEHARGGIPDIQAVNAAYLRGIGTARARALWEESFAKALGDH